MPLDRSSLLLGAAAGFASAVASGLYAYFHRAHRTRGNSAFRRALLGSTASLKLEAAQLALPGCSVEGVEVESTVRDQPLGLEETLRGARGRLTAIVESPAAEQADLAIAIENGLVCIRDSEDAEKETWVDLAVVVVRNLKSGVEGVSTSAGIQFPTALVADWAEAGAEGTVGAWLASEHGCNKQDPHAYLTRGDFPRSALLKEAIGAAIAALAN
eukprot:scaffold78085_cov44-Tisochrysis_lutea.AAC.2